ncbi:transcription cofactor vestigial-like protein 4 isoform x2 [Limosa lapponica baueri]|uniref:Transcription cofactor vestigial-like protein 4 isoform x2 n=1 Tax=Limosa lapponica baueri TaxID=1758121 RepID=A0A2I0TQI7_LIMLA|nr:transcription cofactor vestigial-like protein 4 isoform x2 [Limosa lapponica baueri]
MNSCEAALRGEPRMQSLPVSSTLTNHRTGPPPISPNKRKLSMDQGDEELDCENDHVSKMSRMFNPHLNKTANGDYRKEHRERSRSPIERAAAPTMSLHANHMYASIPSLTMDQPLALTKNSMDATRTVGITPTLTSVERQQNRPSVITCASANNRNCNLSHCPIAHSGCGSAVPAYRRPSSIAASKRGQPQDRPQLTQFRDTPCVVQDARALRVTEYLFLSAALSAEQESAS